MKGGVDLGSQTPNPNSEVKWAGVRNEDRRLATAMFLKGCNAPEPN